MVGKTALVALLLGGLLIDDAVGQRPAGSLVFSKRRRGDAGTYVADPEGRDPKRIMFLWGPEVAPRFSPDGKRILFTSVKAGKPSLWTANRDGQDRQAICEGNQASWSPDGSKIYFRRGGQIVQRTLQSGDERFVGPPGYTSCCFPECSPDGKSLLVVAEAGGRAKLLVMPLGGRISEVLAELSVASPARWSPEGRRIAYSDGAHLYVMAADRSWKYRLTTGGGIERFPAWSPDGTMLAYGHAPTVNANWSLCVAKADGTPLAMLPREEDFVSCFAPDWHVANAKPAESAASIRPPARVAVWETAGPVDAAARRNDWLRKRESWKPVTGSRRAENAIVVENERALALIRPDSASVLLCPKPVETETPWFELVAVNPAGESPQKASLTLAKNDGEEAVVEVSASAPGGRAIKMSWRMCGAMPFVQVAPLEGVASLRIRGPLPHVVVPDRFAADVVYEPALYGGNRVAIPATSMVLGLAGRGDTLLQLTSSAGGQTIDLVKHAGQAACFSGVEARFNNAAISVGVLTGPRLWHAERPNVKYERKRVDLGWEMPGPATWRLAVRADGKVYTEMFTEKDILRLDNKKLFLTPQEEFSGVIDSVVVYRYGRSPGTPLESLTPLDLALDGLGIERFAEVLDIDGLQSYRTAPRPTMWADVFAALRSLGHLYDRNAEKAEKMFAEHQCDDIRAFLEGMDGRVEAFVAFRRELAALAKGLEGGPPDAAALMAGVKPVLDKLDEACVKREKLPLTAEAVRAAAEIKQLTPQDVKDPAEKKKQFSALSDKIAQAARGRADLIRAFRALAKELCQQAAAVAAEHPDARDPATKMRRLAHAVLRNRYYFEADWHGEPYKVAPFWLGPRPY